MMEPKGSIKKANLTFTTKFLWLLVRYCLYPTTADNIVTWDRVVLIAAMIAGFEVDFVWLLQVVRHDKAFKETITYPFACMVFSLCRLAGVPLWYIDALKTAPGTIDIGLILDEANELAPHRGPHPEVQPLGKNLAATVEKSQEANSATSEPTDTTTIESIPSGSTTPILSRSTPSATLVPLARVQKLEAQMATLLHHIHPWMQRSIVEAEERLERKMAQYTERKVHQRLDAFELRFLA